MNWKLKAIEMEAARYTNKEIAKALRSCFPSKIDGQVSSTATRAPPRTNGMGITNKTCYFQKTQ